MTKWRVVEYINHDGKSSFVPQRKCWFIWCDERISRRQRSFGSLSQAKSWISQQYGPKTIIHPY